MLILFSGEHRTGSLAGNTRNSCERMRISSLGGINDYTDNMDNPSSREDISEMYVSRKITHLFLSIFIVFVEIIVHLFIFYIFVYKVKILNEICIYVFKILEKLPLTLFIFYYFIFCF